MKTPGNWSGNITQKLSEQEKNSLVASCGTFYELFSAIEKVITPIKVRRGISKSANIYDSRHVINILYQLGITNQEDITKGKIYEKKRISIIQRIQR